MQIRKDYCPSSANTEPFSNSVVQILCTTDDSYALPYGVMLTSLFENNPDSSFCIWILTDGLSEKNINLFVETSKTYAAELHFIVVDRDHYKTLPLKKNDRYSISGYYCLFAADLLPDTVSQVLYLDGDIIVLANIKDLWKTNMDNAAIAGVLDFNYKKHTQRLGMTNRYINSGVLLMNLDYHRKYDITKKYKNRLSYIDSHRDEFVFHDQDIFNYVCDQNINYLSVCYNFLTPFWLQNVNIQDYDNNPTGIVKIRECIIHYAGYPKPWVTHYYDQPFNNVWLFYYNKSKWKEQKIVGNVGVIKKIVLYVLRILVKIGFIKLKQNFKTIKEIDPTYVPN